MAFSLPTAGALTTPGYKRSVLLRRIIAGLLLVAAAASSMTERVHKDPEVVVFTRDVSPGEVLTAGDLALRPLPEGFAPGSAVRSLPDAEDQVVASAASAGEVVTATRLLGPDLVSSLVAARANDGAADPGRYTLVPVKLAEPDIIPMLHHGDEVSVVTVADAPADPNYVPARTIAEGGTVVIAGTPISDGGTDSPTAAHVSDGDAGILLLLRNEDAPTVAAASLTSPLAVILTDTGEQ